MSDTSGASDLQNDMPALGPQTGNVRGPPMQLPSALQGLAKFFNQTQPRPPQGPPGPKIPPKPPLTEAQANQPPQHTGKPASLAPLPAIVPTPSGGFTPYIPTPNKREIEQWTDPVRFPRLPATFELPGLFNRAGQYFAQAGGQTGDLASQLSGHSMAYIDAFMKAQDWKMKIEREGIANASSRLEESITNRLIDYKNTFSAYRAAGGENKLLNGVDLYHAQWENAIKDGDTNAIAMFEAGRPLKEIEAYLAEADKNLRDLQAARQKAGDQEAEDAAAHGIGPKAEANDAFNANPTPTQPAATATAPTADTPDWAKGLDPTVVDTTERHFRGAALPGENKIIGRFADGKVGEMDTAVNKVIDDAHAGRIKPDEVMPAIRKIVGPRIAADAEGVGSYSQPGFGSGMGSGGSQRASDYARLLDDIAKAADPPDVEHGHLGFVANGYALQDEFKKNNQIRTVQDRINALPADADEVRGDVYALRQKGYSMNDINWQGIEDQLLAGNSDFQKIRSDMIAYSTAFQTIQGGGRATLGGTRDVEATFPAQAPLSTYFSVMKGHMGDMRGQISSKHKDWESRGGNPNLMPRGDRGVERRIDDYWRMDPKSGAFPYDPKNPDNDRIKKPAGTWGPAGEYYWTDAVPTNRDDPRNWKRVE